MRSIASSARRMRHFLAAAEREIRAHFDETEEPISLKQKVRIFLVAEGFNPEITTTALYLRSLNLDITCLSLTAYKVDKRVLIDVEQVIPLPETEQFQIELGKKRAEKDAAEEGARKPRALFFIATPNERQESLTKNRLILELTKRAAAAGSRRQELPQRSRGDQRISHSALRAN